MAGHDFDPEKLRTAEHIYDSDPRMPLNAWCDTATSVIRPVQASHLYDAVAAFSLHSGVPEPLCPSRAARRAVAV
jgi:hypothetical protein